MRLRLRFLAWRIVDGAFRDLRIVWNFSIFKFFYKFWFRGHMIRNNFEVWADLLGDYCALSSSSFWFSCECFLRRLNRREWNLFLQRRKNEMFFFLYVSFAVVCLALTQGKRGDIEFGFLDKLRTYYKKNKMIKVRQR